MRENTSFPARVRRRLRRLPVGPQRVTSIADQVSSLTVRVAELEAELLDARSQGRRIAEISDLVTELLVSEANRRDPDFQRIVDKYLGE